MYLYCITSRKHVESISYMESNETHWMNLSWKPHHITSYFQDAGCVHLLACFVSLGVQPTETGFRRSGAESLWFPRVSQTFVGYRWLWWIPHSLSQGSQILTLGFWILLDFIFCRNFPPTFHRQCLLSFIGSPSLSESTGKRTPFFWNIAARQSYSITTSRAVTPENQPSLHKHRRFLSARWFGLNIS